MTKGNEKRRFCLIGPTYPYRGGISHYNTCLIRELSGAGDICAINFTRLYPGFLFPGTTQLDESARPLTADSTRLIDSINPFTWIRAGVHAARGKPDLVLVQWWHPFFAPAMFTICLVAKLMRRAKVVFICHNVLPHEKSLFGRLLAALAFSVSDGFLVHSREDRDTLLRIRRNAPVIVHAHPIYEFFGTGRLTKEAARAKIGAGSFPGPLLLFFGYIRGYKGLSYLIEAMPLIREKVPATLLVVGEFYDDPAPYAELVERLGLADAVRFENRYVANEEVEGFFVASDLVVLPYVSATQSGIVQIAIALNRPVVATDVGGLSEAVSPEKTGFVVPPRDPAALARGGYPVLRGGMGGEDGAPLRGREEAVLVEGDGRGDRRARAAHREKVSVPMDRTVYVIVLNWNGRDVIGPCLASLSRVTEPPLEIIVVDNASTDGSAEIVGREAPGAELIVNERNLLFAEGNNVGLRRAIERGGSLFLLLNNDTEVDPAFVARMLEALDRDPAAGIVGPKIVYHDDPRRIWYGGGGFFPLVWIPKHENVRSIDGSFPERGGETLWVTGCAMLVRREVIDAVGLLDPSYRIYCEDVDFCLTGAARRMEVPLRTARARAAQGELLERRRHDAVQAREQDREHVQALQAIQAALVENSHGSAAGGALRSARGRAAPGRPLRTLARGHAGDRAGNARSMSL